MKYLYTLWGKKNHWIALNHEEDEFYWDTQHMLVVKYCEPEIYRATEVSYELIDTIHL